ncbi:MAG: MOSC domain-containing protein [Pyrinomonadaceae bacterium]|nr:MOSC domain-containing protein [Pyrinomonadaceae bacterium]
MQISEINIYPIKSLGGISLNEAIIEERGFKHDRRFMLIDEFGEFMTQRDFPKMATIKVSLDENNLIVSANNFEDLQIPFSHIGESVKVQVWNSFCDAVVCGKKYAEWFSKVLQTKCELVYMPNDSRRHINQRFNVNDDIVSFADGYPFLLIGENSLNELNARLENKVQMNRFRPNIVIKNSEAFAEDSWKKIKIGETVFRSTKPCARCVMTTIDQSEGVKTGKEPLKTLATYRLAKQVFPTVYEQLGLNENDVLFGQNLVAENFGKTVKVGDNVEEV